MSCGLGARLRSYLSCSSTCVRNQLDLDERWRTLVTKLFAHCFFPLWLARSMNCCSFIYWIFWLLWPLSKLHSILPTGLACGVLGLGAQQFDMQTCQTRDAVGIPYDNDNRDATAQNCSHYILLYYHPACLGGLSVSTWPRCDE